MKQAPLFFRCREVSRSAGGSGDEHDCEWLWPGLLLTLRKGKDWAVASPRGQECPPSRDEGVEAP